MKKIILRFGIVILSLVFVLPVLLTLFSSFTSGALLSEIKETVNLIPKGFSFVGYYDILIEYSWFIRGFWNSIFYALVITVINILISVPAAYAFSEAKFKGKSILYFFYIVLMMMPIQVTILPNYIGLRDMKLMDTPFAIILPAIFAPFGVFLMCQYLSGLEKSTIEAARLETSSVLTILIQVVAPQVRTCILALFVFIFAENWNMVEQPNVFLTNIKLMPLSVLLAISENVNLVILLAGSVIFMLPIVILYMYFHDSLEAGLESFKV